MDSAIIKTGSPARFKAKPESGFTLIETMISIVVLSIGLLGILASFAMALGSTQNVQLDEIAKQKALEGLESIYTARQTQQISFAQIANVPTGIFVNGFSAGIMGPGPDGLDGTADDGPVAGCPGNFQCVILPGPDGVLGTGDDVTLSLSNFQRQILIGPVNNPDGSVNTNLKQVTVTVQYPTPEGKQHSYTVQSLISSYR
ncbi:MAG: prepilin-type N-terminal cleavage/methylation domain-containing protein [Acidobacteriales bacterium]|nr:prepilin-type N-terminal cleavage/methylation domain-containing protein [Terriglobales bacterium]